MPKLAFEDFAPGTDDLPGTITVSKDDIVGFARKFDPQPFHLDEVAAAKTPVGGLIASGWHSCALAMRLIADGFLNDSTALGSPGIDEVKWLKPVRPGDTLRVRRTILDTKTSKSRPELGLVQFRFETLNQAGIAVMEQNNWIMFGRRGTKAVPLVREARPPAAAAPEFVDGGGDMALFDDLVIGDTIGLGAHTFTAEDIVAYARDYDPQPFHLDEEAARKSLFGGLCASGWHTAAIWMKLMIARRTRLVKAAMARGEHAASLGPSPGFRDLKWLKPVYAGDTVRFRSTLKAKRASSARPGWGLVFHHNVAENQYGERVFEFQGCVFWERDPSKTGDGSLRV